MDRGAIRIYHTDSDTLTLIRFIPEEYVIKASLTKGSKKILGYCFDNIFEWRVHESTTAMYSQDLIVYEDILDTLVYLFRESDYGKTNLQENNFEIKNICMSNNGEYSFIRNEYYDDDSLKLYEIRTGKVIKSIFFKDTLSSIACSNDNKYLLLGWKNSISLYIANELIAIDTISFSGFNGIYDLLYSPDGNNVYFKSNNCIYRFPSDFKALQIKDNLQTEKIITVSPNPTTGEIIIQENSLVRGQLRIDLMDVYGGLVSNLFDGNYDGGYLISFS